MFWKTVFRSVINRVQSFIFIFSSSWFSFPPLINIFLYTPPLQLYLFLIIALEVVKLRLQQDVNLFSLLLKLCGNGIAGWKRCIRKNPRWGKEISVTNWITFRQGFTQRIAFIVKILYFLAFIWVSCLVFAWFSAFPELTQ